MTIYFENTLNVETITLEDLLKKFGKTEDDIDKIYHGKDHWCRCGCGGNYFYKNVKAEQRGFTRALNALKKENFKTCDIEQDGLWLNIPDATKDNMCYCIYFKKDN